MPTASSKSAFLAGVHAAAPFFIIIVPFAMIFGVIGTEAGLDIAQVMGLSVLVIAGAAQITAVQLMQDHAPTLVVLATALAVNLRMAMYSASMAPHLPGARLWQRALVAYFLVDQSYALSMVRFQDEPCWGVAEKFRFFLGTAVPVAFLWYLGTLGGALAGQAIPEAWSLDVAVPLAFLAIVAPALRTPAHMAAALVALLASLALAWLPYSLGVIGGGALGMLAGAEVERRMSRPAPATERRA